jgi:hypothetical protein
MQDIIQLARHVDELAHIVMVEGEILAGHQVGDVIHGTCEEVVHTDYPDAFLKKAIGEVGAQETGGAGY